MFFFQFFEYAIPFSSGPYCFWWEISCLSFDCLIHNELLLTYWFCYSLFLSLANFTMHLCVDRFKFIHLEFTVLLTCKINISYFIFKVLAIFKRYLFFPFSLSSLLLGNLLCICWYSWCCIGPWGSAHFLFYYYFLFLRLDNQYQQTYLQTHGVFFFCELRFAVKFS